MAVITLGENGIPLVQLVQTSDIDGHRPKDGCAMLIDPITKCKMFNSRTMSSGSNYESV